jgi:hypothetical protein
LTTVLVVGVPRSGTSWLGRVLGSTPGASYLGEPDNHEHVPFALRAKLGLPGRLYPDLAPEFDASAYERLWRTALEDPGPEESLARARRRLALRLLRRATSDDLLRSIARPSDTPFGLRLASRIGLPERRPTAGGNLVVKSVHAQLALEWIVSRFPVSVLLVMRHPLNVLSSWKDMGWLAHGGALEELGPESAAALARACGLRPLHGGSALEEAAQLIALLNSALVEAARRRPEWNVASHEELCAQPHERFPVLAEALGLGWDDRVDRLIDELNRPGTGYDTARVASSLHDVWRSRLTADEVRAASEIFDDVSTEWASS